MNEKPDYRREILLHLHAKNAYGFTDITDFIKSFNASEKDLLAVLSWLVKDELVRSDGEYMMYFATTNNGKTRINKNAKFNFKLEESGRRFVREEYLQKLPVLSIDNSQHFNFGDNAKDVNVVKGNIITEPNPTKKSKLELSHIIAIAAFIVGFIVMLWGNNLLGRFTFGGKDKTKTNTTVHLEQKHDTLLTSIELPYLENVPIIDKSLFIKYYYNDFILGGVNIDTISINARNKMGESLKLNKMSGEIQMDITQEPYIEFEYKGALYSIETNGRHYSISCKLRKNIKQTLQLKKYSKI